MVLNDPPVAPVRRRRWAWPVTVLVGAVCAITVVLGTLGSGPTRPPRAAAALPVATLSPHAPTPATALQRLIRDRPIFFSGSTRGRVVALTFDDGPGPYTARIVAMLRHLKATATFFEIGSQIAPYRALVARMVKWGFVIGDHTWSHPNLERLSNVRVRTQLVRTMKLVTKISGQQVQLARPPYGAQNTRIRTDVGRLGLLSVLWNIDTRDWTQPGTQAIVAHALAVRAGGIILLHDGGGLRSQTVAALPAIVHGLRARGFRIVTIPQLLVIAPPTSIHS